MSISTSQPNVYKTQGTITGANQEVTLQCDGAAGAIVTVVGTFTGTLSSVGGTDTIDGGRLLFKSGVGSIGTNKIFGEGVPISREYRIIAGGERYTIQSGASFTGTANIEIQASNSTNTVFLNGPAHSAVEESTRARQAFLASTGAVSASSGNIIIATLKNPANSGVNLFLHKRKFSNNVAATANNVEYIAYSNPTYEPTGGVGTGFNAWSSEANSVAEFKFQVRSITGLTIGGIQGTGEILPRGAPYDRIVDFVLPPNRGVGFVIEGQGNNLTQAIRASITLEWYEESVN